MIDYLYKDLFQMSSLPKRMQIDCSDGSVFREDDWEAESVQITEQLCTDSELIFGSCEASIFKIRFLNRVGTLTGKWLTVRVYLKGAEDAPFLIGNYKVYSDKPTADRRYRDIVAYDAMHDLLHADVAAWYNGLKFPMTLKAFRDSFFSYMGVAQEAAALVNDGMTVEKTIEPGEISGKTVIEAICEINGCFGHIGRDGKFRYVILKEMIEGLYPADDLYPANDLYPADPQNATEISKSDFISGQYEDASCRKITMLQIRQEENDIGAVSGSGDNCYVIEDNFLVYGKSAADLQTVADNVYGVINVVWYRPAEMELRGNPCVEVGDGVRVEILGEIVYTYILQRTLKGIQALRDTYSANGKQDRSGKRNSLQKQIIQLKGKTNTLTRTVEETRLEMKDIEQGLSNEISITAQGLSAEITRASAAEGNLSTQLQAQAGEIALKV